MQKRGLLHAHPVLAYSTSRERAAADRYMEILDQLRARFGFGYIERKRRVRDPRAAAAYLSSYFVTGKGGKISLQESVQSNWMPRSIIQVSTELTRLSGITMRSLRLRRYAWVVWRNGEANLWALCGGLQAHDLWCAFKQDVTLTELMASAIHARGWMVLDV